MEVTFTRPTSRNNTTPAFSANLKGSAIRSAIDKSKLLSEVAELREILDNVKDYGDRYTEIICEKNGSVSVTNSKFGNVVHNFMMKLNEKSKNPFLDMIARFNTENFIMKCESDLIEKRFAMAKPSSKKSLYEMYKSSNLASTTQILLDFTARKHGVLKAENVNKNIDLTDWKKRMFPEYIK